jgi:hypothetical protein
MEAMMREVWTDERLDGLNRHMEAGFARLHTDVRDMQRTMVQGFVALAAGMLTGFGGIIALIATQL